MYLLAMPSHLADQGRWNFTYFQRPHHALEECEVGSTTLSVSREVGCCRSLRAPLSAVSGLSSPSACLRALMYTPLPRLRMGCSARSGMFSPPAVNTVLSSLTPFLIDRLLDLAGLIFIRAQAVSSSKRLRSRAVHGAVCRMLVTSSMYPLRAGSLPPDGDFRPLAICPRSMSNTSNAATKRIGEYGAAHCDSDFQLLPSRHVVIYGAAHVQVVEVPGYDVTDTCWHVEEFQGELNQLVWY